VEAPFTVAAGQIVGADVELLPAVAVLERVEVTARAVTGPLAGLAESVRRSGATFVGRATLDSAQAAGRGLSDVLRAQARGVRMVMSARTGATYLASGRGMPSMRRVPSADPTDPSSPKGCFAQVVLDGVRVYTPDGPGTPAPDLSRYNLATVEALAFYPGPATTPAAYGGNGAACGTLVIWTRR
jgi:hypothetical protein